MSSYIKELLNLKEQITQSTNNIIKKYDSLEMELLEKAKNKLNKQYDSLLEGIEGRRMQFDFTTYDSVTRQKYKMEFLLCSNVPFNAMQSNYGNFVTVKINNNERIILNSNYNGYSDPSNHFY